jgi:hypothetical protein
VDQQERGSAGPSLPVSPTGRLPQWVVDEAAGLTVSPVPWRADPPPPLRRRRLPGVLLVVLVLVVSLGGAVLVGPHRWPWEPPPRSAPSVPPTPAAPTDRPPPGLEAAARPLGVPLPPPPEGGPHGFTNFQDDGVTPVAYDPCRPVHYVLRPDSAPAGGEQIVHDAVTRLTEVTGLRFVHDGPTDEPPSADRAVFQPDRYGDRWAPVLIAWQTEAENPALAGDFVGEAGSTAVSLGDGPRVYVTGTVSLDATQLPEVLGSRNGPATVRGIVLHELAHLVGLAHVDDVTQLMHPETQRGVTDFAAGDLTGLARLGSGVCVPEL